MCETIDKSFDSFFIYNDEGFEIFKDFETQSKTKEKDTYSFSEETKDQKLQIFKICKTRMNRQLKKDFIRQKNKISQKKSRERKKLDIIHLVNENKKLILENKNLHEKMQSLSEKLCPSCHNLFFKQNTNNSSKKQSFILSISPSSISTSKVLTYVTSVIALVCLFLNIYPQFTPVLKTFLFPNKNIVDKILTSNRLLNEAKNTRNSNLYLNVKQISEAQKLPDAGVFMSFGDFYSVTTQNSFLESKYDFINNGKIRVIKDSSYASSIPQKCEKCLLEINADNIIRHPDNLHFKLFLPQRRFWEKDNNTQHDNNYTIDVTTVDEFMIYEVECEVVGFGQNKLKPFKTKDTDK